MIYNYLHNNYLPNHLIIVIHNYRPITSLFRPKYYAGSVIKHKKQPVE